MKRKVIFRRSLLLFLSVLFVAQLSAQNRTITGTVKDADTGTELPGATVVVKGTSFGTATNYEGAFELSAKTGDVLVITFVGYVPQEIILADQSSLDVLLNPSSSELDELVVIGYGKVKKSDATGAVATVSADDFNKGAITSAQDLLVGKSAGVVITTSGGAPGSGSTIRIRGGSSLNASNDPLVIVDGVPLDNNGLSGSANFLDFINPNDIESMTVLKDASATAIYGSRASNGVILITTKKGQAGKMRIGYNGFAAVSSPISFLDVYSGDEMRALAWEKRDIFGENTLSQLGTENTNWQEAIFRNSITHDHNLTMSGKASIVPYRVSLGYVDQQGIVLNTDMQRITGSVNLNPTFMDDNLKVNVNVKGMNTNNNFGDAGAVGSALNMDPTQSIYEDNDATNGYFQWAAHDASLGTPNPVSQALDIDNSSLVQRVVASAQIDFTMPFLPELRANLNIAGDYSKSEGINDRPITVPQTLTGSYTGVHNEYSANHNNSLLDFYLNYNNNLPFLESNIDVTAGYSYQHFKRYGESASNGLISDTADSRYAEPVSNNWIGETYLVSFFGRANYSIMGKYLFTGTLRADGSSRFAKEQRWGIFPSAAFAWKISEESFLENASAVSNLKLRVSYGKTGQQDIGSDYPSQALYVISSPGSYYPIGGEYIPTLRPNAYDPLIQWEETSTLNAGLDFGFINNRISGSIDFYHRETVDLLNDVTVPSLSNFSNSLFTNVGNLENRGVELSFEFIPISTKDMNLTIGFNTAYNENNVTRLLLNDDPNYIGILGGGDAFTGYRQITRVGYPISSFFLNQQVYYPDGMPIEGVYVDLSGNGGDVAGDSEDQYIIYNPVPKYIFGLSARFTYKNFDFSASSRAALENYVFNAVRAGSSYDQMSQLNYWKTYPKILEEAQFVTRQFTSDFFLENASYFKLDNISAGYRFENIVNDIDARVSFTVENAITITNYSGIDPEVPGGIDNTFYPRPRTFLLGVNFTF